MVISGVHCIKICNIKPPQLPVLSCFLHVEDVYKHRSGLSGIKSRWGRDFPRPFKLALGPIQPPAQWVPGLSTGAWRWPPTPSSAEVKESVELYLYCPFGRTLVTFSRANFTDWILQLPLLLVRTVICRCSNQAAGCTAERLLVRTGHFSPLDTVQTDSGTHSALSSGTKQPEREADHSPPSTVEIKNGWSYTFPLPCGFMACIGSSALRTLYALIILVFFPQCWLNAEFFEL